MSRTYSRGSSVVRPSGSRQATQTSSRPGQQQQQRQDSDHVSPTRRSVYERMERRDAYTVIAPDEQKRQSLLRNAEEEQRKYEEYRQRSRPHHFNYVGTVGGDTPAVAASAGAESSVRRQNLQAGRQLTVQQKSQVYRAQQKQRENAELEKKKEEQRQKAAINEERDRQRTERLDEDRRRKMDSFLNKMEAESRNSVVHRQAAAQVAMDFK